MDIATAYYPCSNARLSDKTIKTKPAGMRRRIRVWINGNNFQKAIRSQRKKMVVRSHSGV